MSTKIKALTLNAKTKIVSAFWLAACMLVAGPVANAGEVIRDKLKSPILGRDLPFMIYLPDGYYESFDKFPAVYLLHGSGGDENTLISYAGVRETLDGLIRRRDIAPAVVVMPAGGTSWWIDGNAEKMQSALISELIPYIEKHYEVQAQRDKRAIAGISMGGFGALNLSLRHPEMVCAAGLLSPGVYTEPKPESSARSSTGQFAKNGEYDPALWQAQSYRALLPAYASKKQIVPFYIESGDHDQEVNPMMLSSLYMALQAVQPEQAELRIVDGDHGWMTFRDGLPKVLSYLNKQCRWNQN